MLLLSLLPVSATTPAFEVHPAASGTAASAPPASVLIGALGRPAPARTAFAEARFMHMLDRPLVVSGQLAWLGGDRLERRVEQPRIEIATIADGEVTQQRQGRQPRHFSLKRAPQLQVLLDSFVALLSGDAERLQHAFAIQISGNASAAWTMTLTPRNSAVASAVASIVIDGYAHESRCLQMRETDGDLAVDLLGPLARHMPVQPTLEALQTLCQSAPGT